MHANLASTDTMRSGVLRALEVPTSKRGVDDDFAMKIWITDSDIAYRLVSVVENYGDKFIIAFRDEKGFFEKKKVAKKDTLPSSISYFCEDICNLSELNEANVLHAIRSRYAARLIHTYSGLFCLVVNPWMNLELYSPEVMHEYANSLDTTANLPPHVYALAQSAYDGLFGGENQSILITGESGAGKTVNTKKIIEYIGIVANKQCPSANNPNRIDEKLTAVGVIIESFANASTVHNSNSSRLGKFIRMDFDDYMQMIGAEIQCYLLEKSRVVKQNEGDRNFHIFYQLLSDAFGDEYRYSLGLGQKANAYRFLNQGGRINDLEINDIRDANETKRSLALVGFSSEEILQINEILASCILLGEIKFSERSGLDITYVDGNKEVGAACRVLGVKISSLIDALTQPSMKVSDVLIKKSQNLRKTLSSLSALCKCIYERLFTWILLRCNAALGESFNMEESLKTKYIGVLDIAGFEIIQKNSFEQFCINYTNEKLQQFFNDFMFIREQQEYESEGIYWQRIDYGNDMQNTIELIEKPLGLFSLLQEECLVPNGSDELLLQKLIANHSSNPAFARSRQSARNTTVAHFCITHYAGVVQYNIDGWVEKNKDAVEKNGLRVLSESSKPIIRILFPPVEEDKPRSRRQPMNANTVTYIYKEQLLSLLDTLNSTRAQFIRCIAPNRNRKPGIIDSFLVLNQLRCNGVLEGVRICRQGYPNRVPFRDFVEKYRILIPQNAYTLDRAGASDLLYALELDENLVQIGKSKVYCKIGVITELENRRRACINAMICKIQATIRWYMQQVECEKRMQRREALLIIQQNVRQYSKVANWRWYRLFLLVKELIPMQQDKKRIEELEKENSQLLEELEKLNKENEIMRKNLCDAEKRISALEHEKAAYDNEKYEMKAEIKRNEELMEVMDKRFDEQHAKIMKIHCSLRENEKKIEQLEFEKNELTDQLANWKEKYEKEYEYGLELNKKAEALGEIVDEYEKKLRNLEENSAKEAQQISKLKNEISSLNEKNSRNIQTIRELRENLSEFDEKCQKFDSILLSEKKAYREAEKRNEELVSEMEHLKEKTQKIMINLENLKEICGEKDQQIKKLHDQLANCMEKAEINVGEMKKIHKQSKDEMQNRMDELRKKCQKLEAENRLQRVKLDSIDRESSVESDYVSGRQSRLGSRQYSSSSIGSFSSIRTMSRRTTEPDTKNFAEKYSPGFRSPSIFSSSYHSEVQALSRSSSQSYIANERKISQLERQLLSSNTDIQILKREIDVYKSTLSQSEKDRELLNQKLRTLTATCTTLENSLTEEAEKGHEVEMKLKKTQNELDALKEKYERSIEESKNELLDERKKMRTKIDALVEENQSKRRDSNAEKTITEMQQQLTSTNNQLDRALSQVARLESIRKTHEAYGETWEHQYRKAAVELESLRDENAMLKTKIRRQYRQIELLTQQTKIEADVTFLEKKMGLDNSVQGEAEAH